MIMETQPFFSISDILRFFQNLRFKMENKKISKNFAWILDTERSILIRALSGAQKQQQSAQRSVEKDTKISKPTWTLNMNMNIHTQYSSSSWRSIVLFCCTQTFQALHIWTQHSNRQDLKSYCMQRNSCACIEYWIVFMSKWYVPFFVVRYILSIVFHFQHMHVFYSTRAKYLAYECSFWLCEDC